VSPTHSGIPSVLIVVIRIHAMQCQFARVAEGVDLRSTASNCVWVRTPQLTFAHSVHACQFRDGMMNSTE
jgi:hypothetical protein